MQYLKERMIVSYDEFIAQSNAAAKFLLTTEFSGRVVADSDRELRTAGRCSLPIKMAYAHVL